MKSFFVLMFLALIALVAGANDYFSFGKYQENETKFDCKRIVAEKKLFCKTSGDYSYEQNIENPIKITRVEATDNSGNGGEVKLISGGPGHTSFTLHYESELDNAFDFNVDIYGEVQK
ncbi:uncharacterized protein [Eurosta solidaginis]|uniref:uncharacterized protein n=1 Tax=Eurosta solidaginis TaxID=178769 RepID=UPI003531790B